MKPSTLRGLIVTGKRSGGVRWRDLRRMLEAYGCEIVDRGNRHVAVYFPDGVGKWTQHVDDGKPMPKPSLRDIDKLLRACGR